MNTIDFEDIPTPVEDIKKSSYNSGYELGHAASLEMGKELGFYKFQLSLVSENTVSKKLSELVQTFPIENNLHEDYKVLMSRIRAKYKLLKSQKHLAEYPTSYLNF
eukprot:NODE_881_length_3338_cov_0.873726.p3 type:complete len:106 gc:universal NODE_881_length_3338_cov_0.873726:336-19(-)